MTKPDRTHVHNDGMKSGNEALIPLTRNMLMVHGTAYCEVQLYQYGALLTSANFEMEIFPSQRDESEIIHSGEYTRLENTIHAAKTISNNYGEIKIDKDITTDRIDPIDAIIDAWKAAMPFMNSCDADAPLTVSFNICCTGKPVIPSKLNDVLKCITSSVLKTYCLPDVGSV